MRALLVTSLVASSAIAAGPTAQDLETARTLYKQGKDLRAAGDLRGALEKLKAAHALGRTPLTGIELARTEAQLMMLVEARETCLGIARMAVEGDETRRSSEARDEAAQLAEQLRPRIPSLSVRIVAAASPPIVSVDGEIVPAVSLDQPRKINPGHHVVVAHVEGGASVTATVDVVEGQTGNVELAPPPPPVGFVPTTPPEGQTQRRSHLNGLTIAGIVVSSVGIVIGVGGGVAALGDSSQINTGVCPGHVCSPDQWTIVSNAKTWATVSTVGFAFGGVGLVMLVVGFITGSSSSTETTHPRGVRVVPDIGLGQVGVHGAF